MVRSAFGWCSIVIVLAASAACSGSRQPVDPSSLTCGGAPADLTIEHRAASAGWGKKNRVVDFDPGVPEVTVTAAGDGQLCVVFDPTTAGWRAAMLSNFTEISGRRVTATPAQLQLTEDAPAQILRLQVDGTGDAVVKYDLRLYRNATTNGNPALLIDPVLMIRR